MDPSHDVPGTTVWSAASSLRSKPSAPVSSSLSLPHQTSMQAEDAERDKMNSPVGPEIAPHEASTCGSLIEQIGVAATLQESARQIQTTNTQASVSLSQLAKAITKSSVTIQYHAKWFAPGQLSTLLQTALQAASRSSATADLYAALDLVEVIITYSQLPTLAPVVRFVAYCYYQGSRSNRHKRLIDRAWTIAQHILGSHLGSQFTGYLLDLISDSDQSRSTLGFGATVGALMLTTQNLLPAPGELLPRIQPTQLLLELNPDAISKNDILREQVTLMLSAMMLDEEIFDRLDNDGSLEICLSLMKHCAGHTLDQTAADGLFKGLENKFSRFEDRNRHDISRLFIDSRRPLPLDMLRSFLEPWERSLIIEEYALWDTEYRDVLAKLCECSYYLEELQAFVEVAVTAFFRVPNPIFKRDFVNTMETLIVDPATEDAIRDILAKGMVSIFTHNMQKPKWEGERGWLFPLLCRFSSECPDAMDLLSRIRADAASEGYIEAPKLDSNLGLSQRDRGHAYVQGLSSLSLETWVSTVHDMIVDSPRRWEVYDTLITSMPAQIRNHALWCTRPHQINWLRQAVCERLKSDSFVDPPAQTGLSKSYVVSHLIQLLTAMTSYHNHLPRNDIKAAISMFINVAGSRDSAVSIHCIHALTICCYELPEVMAGYMDAIISKMSKMVTQRHLAIYVLEFLAGLSRLSSLQEKLRSHDLKKIFGVCHSYLQTIRGSIALERRRTPTSERSGGGSSSSTDDMAQYVYALAHHVITFWYVALKKNDRRHLKDYITSCLNFTDVDGKGHIEDQGLVTIDLMDRVDAEEDIIISGDTFDEFDGKTHKLHRLSGLLLITTETAMRTSKTIITIRRPSGTAQRMIASHKRAFDPTRFDDHAEHLEASVTVETDNEEYISIFPDDIQGRTYGKVFLPRPASALGSIETITLSDDSASVKRAIESFDRTSALDSHKAGVIYVGEGQTTETEILLNTSGSPDYRDFLDDLGTLRRLKGATFNAQGLDRADNADGEHTIVWNNDVTELVYHITTFMPSDPHDHKMTVINKKRHIGNDFVNMIFNNSGVAFRFDTFPSAFNYVYIVISPSERTSFLQARTITIKKEKKERFYNVHVLTRPGYPNISSASEVKVISGASLGGYVRNLALNACVFSAMWNADDVGEYPSSWRRRLHMLRQLAEQHRPKSVATNSSGPLQHRPKSVATTNSSGPYGGASSSSLFSHGARS